jgi:hypothetical protein
MARKAAADEPQLPAEDMPADLVAVHMSFGSHQIHMAPVEHVDELVGQSFLGILRGKIKSAELTEDASGVRKINATLVCEVTQITPKQYAQAAGVPHIVTEDDIIDAEILDEEE